MSYIFKNRDAGRLNLGDILTARINSKQDTKNPQIRYSQYFIYIQPMPENNGYMGRYSRLREGEFVTVQITEMKEGCYGRCSCNAILYDENAQKRRGMKNIAGIGKFVSFEDELQRFGNKPISDEQMIALRRKWGMA